MENSYNETTNQPNEPKRKKRSFFLIFIKLCFVSFILGVIGLFGIVFHYSKGLPNFSSIADYKPKLITKLYSENSSLIAEYAQEKRIYVKIEDVPEKLIQALLATEDQLFYEHQGFDPKGIARAFVKNLVSNTREGASTITQQLVKNTLLTNERTYERKIKEIILSYRVEKAFSKDEILELYLNHIYLGGGSYGIMQAALNYFNKDLQELTNSEIATLVGLPKAPNRYNPIRNPKVATHRRDVVLQRMLETGIITHDEFVEAVQSEIQTHPRPKYYGQVAPDFAEHVRRKLLAKYGQDGLYTSGMSVNTTLNMDLQKAAQEAVVFGVKRYDKRHGWRGPIAKLVFFNRWDSRVETLKKDFPQYSVIGKFAYVELVDDENKVANIVDEDNIHGIIPLKELEWARKFISIDEQGPKVKKVSDVLEKGDIILVAKKESKESKDTKENESEVDTYILEQFPEVQAALVAMDPRTGAIKAMVGGFDKQGTFNRAIQAKRQVGSAFKPFVYAAALENGFTANSIIMDAPIILRSQTESWKPQNYSEKVYGPSTLRRGLEKSRNLMTINLARELGISKIIKFASRLGIPTDEMEPDLSTALGSASLSLIDMVAAYGVFANEGVFNPPYFIETIQDFNGSSVYSRGTGCLSCHLDSTDKDTIPYELESIEPTGTQVLSDSIAYIVTNLMQGVVERGTGWRAKRVGIPVAAKTGSTNNFMDAWFVGFSPDLVVGVWSGFDVPSSLGMHESGSGVSGPIWTEFMVKAKNYLPNSNFKIPEDVVFVKVDQETGQIPNEHTKSTILEVFVNGTEPNSESSGDLYINTEADTNILDGVY